MKKYIFTMFLVVVFCLEMFYMNIGITKAMSNNAPPTLLSINNAITISKTCVKSQPLDYQPCSLFIPKGKHIFVYIYTVEKYYKIVYITGFSHGKPTGVYGWAERKTVKYNCCQ